MILHLLEDPEQTDDKVVTVHDQAYSDKANQRQLFVANPFANGFLVQIWKAGGTWDLVIPGGA